MVIHVVQVAVHNGHSVMQEMERLIGIVMPHTSHVVVVSLVLRHLHPQRPVTDVMAEDGVNHILVLVHVVPIVIHVQEEVEEAAVVVVLPLYQELLPHLHPQITQQV
jgi:methylmalonyl-CoA mutase cobalamin-binding subunit